MPVQISSIIGVKPTKLQDFKKILVNFGLLANNRTQKQKYWYCSQIGDNTYGIKQQWWMAATVAA
jgi:hypothetical protein